jgi:hypothetical protein
MVLILHLLGLLATVGIGDAAGNITTRKTVASMPSLADIFDKKKIHAYFLSGGNKDRIEGCLKVVESFGLEKRHYDFINGPMNLTEDEISEFHKNGSLAYYNGTKKANMGRFMCQLGILRTMNAFLASEHEEMILFEDDVTVPREYNLRDTVEYARLMLSIPTEEYDMQFLGYCFECVRPIAPIRLASSIEPLYYTLVQKPLCAHAVLFKKKAIKAFMELTTPFNRPGDVAMADGVCSTGMNIKFFLLSSRQYFLKLT